MSLRRFVVLGLFILALLGGVRRVEAESGDDLTRRALTLRREGEDEKALVLLRQVYGQSHSPRSAAQLGLCEQALGRWAEAETYMTEAVRADSDPWIRKNRHTLDEALGAIKSHIARIEVLGDPVDAEVLINGSAVGRLPLPGPIHVGAGEIQIEMRAPGHAPGSKSVHVEGGQYQKIVLRLERAPTQSSPAVVALAPPAATAAPSEGPAPAGTSATAPVPPPPLATDDSEGTPRAWRGALKWVAWGGAAVGLGVGGYGVAKNVSLVGEFNGGCGFDQGVLRPTDGSKKTLSQCVDLKNRYEYASRVGIAGFVGAGVLGALGFVLWLTEPDTHKGETLSTTAYACAPLISGRDPAVGCVWRF